MFWVVVENVCSCSFVLCSLRFSNKYSMKSKFRAYWEIGFVIYHLLNWLLLNHFVVLFLPTCNCWLSDVKIQVRIAWHHNIVRFQASVWYNNIIRFVFATCLSSISWLLCSVSKPRAEKKTLTTQNVPLFSQIYCSSLIGKQMSVWCECGTGTLSG